MKSRARREGAEVHVVMKHEGVEELVPNLGEGVEGGAAARPGSQGQDDTPEGSEPRRPSIMAASSSSTGMDSK